MKQIIYEKSSRHVIHVDDVDYDRAIIGYKSKDGGLTVKGMLVTGNHFIRGVTVAVEEAAEDTCPPMYSDDLKSIDLDMSNFIQNAKDDWTFFRFNTVRELLIWILT